MHKSDIYDLVEQHRFLDFRGTESQDVCFLEKDNVSDEIKATQAYQNGEAMGDMCISQSLLQKQINLSVEINKSSGLMNKNFSAMGE